MKKNRDTAILKGLMMFLMIVFIMIIVVTFFFYNMFKAWAFISIFVVCNILAFTCSCIFDWCDHLDKQRKAKKVR